MTDFNFREQSYWCRKGKYENAVEKLDLIIDDQLIYDGPWKASMPKSSGKNYHLERLRKAKYAYYRFHNDGDQSSILTKGAKKLGFYCAYNESVEAVLNAKIEAAWKEQTGQDLERDIVEPQKLDMERMLSEVFDKVFFKESEV